MFWAMIWIMIQVVNRATNGPLRTLYHPQDGPPLPVLHLSQTLADYLIEPRPLRPLLGFRTPPSPTTPGTGLLSASSTISLRSVRGYTFQDSTASRRSVSALRGFVTQPRSVSTLPSKGLRGANLYSPPLHASHEESVYRLP